MKKLAQLVIRYKYLIIAITVLVTIILGYYAAQITINSDMLSYLKPNDPDVKLFERIGDEYGGNTLVLVAVECDNLLTEEGLTLIRDITDAYQQIPGIASVVSLTNILDIKKTEDGLEVGKLLDRDNLPRTPEALRELKEYILGKDMYAGRIISRDGKTALIVNRLQVTADKSQVAQQIVQRTKKKPGFRFYFGGLPAQINEMNDHIVKDLKRLIPFVVLMVILTLYVNFRTKRGVLLPLAVVLISTVWSMGLMALLGYQLSIISDIMPVVLIAIGTAYGIHFIAKYREEVAKTEDKMEGIRTALTKVGVPILLTGITTLIGFLSFLGSYLTAVNDFGLFTAVGVAIAMVMSLTFLPAVLSLLKVKERAVNSPDKTSTSLMTRFMNRAGGIVLSRRKIILGSSILLLILAIAAIPRLSTEVNFDEYLPVHSSARIASEIMREKFGGSMPIQIVIRGDLKNPFVLKEMIRMEKYLNALPAVNNPQSLADLICEMNKVMNGHYTIPPTSDQVANLLFMLEGEEIMDQLVNHDYSEGIIQARFASQDTKTMLEIVTAIDHYLWTEMDTVMQIIIQDELNDDVKEHVNRFLLNQVTTAVKYDAQNRVAGVAFPDSLFAHRLEALLTKSDIPFDAEFNQTLTAELIDYFTDEADVEIDSRDVIQQVVAKLVEQVRSGSDTWNAQRVQQFLRAHIPPKYWVYDPESIEYTAETLVVRIQEQLHNNRIRYLVNQLLPLLPDSLRNNARFKEDLRDDLWIINEHQIGVPRDLVNTDGEETVRLSAVQSGMVKVMKKVNDNLLKSQFQSLFIALVLVLVLMSVQFKSLRMGLVVTSPIVGTILFNFTLMGFLGIPLDNATMMIASIAIGIGIDYAIHFSSRFKMELQQVPDEHLALGKTLATTGHAIVINAITVALGFIILLGSDLIPIQRFGWLIAVTMVVSATAALSFLPALILASKRWLRLNGK